MASLTLLTSIAGRTALLAGLAAGTVSQAELEYHVLKDNEKRRWKVPVVVEGYWFESLTKAAHYLYAWHPDLWKTTAAGKRKDKFAVLNNLRMLITRRCDADRMAGYYWA